MRTTAVEFAKGVSLQLHILVVDRMVVDPAVRWSDPCCPLARLIHALHQAQDVPLVALAGQPPGLVCRELLVADGLAFGRRRHTRPIADVPPEARTRQSQAERVARLLNQPVPALQTDL